MIDWIKNNVVTVVVVLGGMAIGGWGFYIESLRTEGEFARYREQVAERDAGVARLGVLKQTVHRLELQLVRVDERLKACGVE